MGELGTDILCRDEQITLLTSLIRESPCKLPSPLFVCGLSGTGKSLVISSVLKHRNVKACYANCIEFYTPRVIYETILNQLAGITICQENNYASYASCDNFSDFVLFIKKITSESQERFALIFEHSERIRSCDANIFPSLCRLHEFCPKSNITVIFSSRLPLEKFRGTMGILEPIIVPFPQYSKDELVKILVSCRPECDISESSHQNYINLLLNLFYLATRNLPELKHLAELNLNAYCEPILKGEAKENDLRLLWRNIEPKLKRALSTVYLREVTSDQFKRMQEITDTDSKELMSKRSSLVKMELPFYSKFLLIASYLASYNPPKTDRRFFTKNHGKKRKTQASIKAQMKSSGQLVGPKAFPLDRMLAIFYAIIEDRVAPTSHIFSQISSLVSLRLLTSLSSEDCLASPKYKSNVSLDFIRSISRTVNFDIVQYLYEFAS